MGKKRMSLSRLQALAAQTTIDTTLYESSVTGDVQQTANFTVPINTNLWIAAPDASTYTGSIAISSMANGQKLTVVNFGGNFLLSASDSGKIFSGGIFVNTASVQGNSITHEYVKVDSVSGTPNVLIKILSGAVG
jgi:hypothetical protein